MEIQIENLHVDDRMEYPIENLHEDDNLVQLVMLYHDDPILFSEQILNITPDVQQKKVILQLYKKGKATVKSGRGCGKTFAGGIIIWHFLCTRSNAQVYITAASGGTIAGAIWPTLAKMYETMSPIYRDQSDFQSTQIKHKDAPFTWFAHSRTARIENPDALAGTHAKQMLYIIDEASGVNDQMFKVISGSLTEEDNYLLMLSNPRKLSGFFFDSFNKPKSKKTYSQLTMSALDSEWVSERSIQDWKDMYGEDSNTYRVEVLGEFPTREDSSIIPWDLVVAASERDNVVPAGEIRWGVDMGAGNDISVLVKRQGSKVFKDVKKWNYRDTMRVARLIMNEYNNTEKEMLPEAIYIDTIGIGKGAGDRLREKGLPIIPAVASNRAVSKKYNYNAKAEWWKEMYEWFRDQEPQIPQDDKLIEELTTCLSVPSNDGRFKIEPKDKYRLRLGRSPDAADALALTFSLKSKKIVGLTVG